ncbi:DNA-binding protein H-NS [Loktanella sp. DSM 29012]|uniref:H-NS histone family protein n=1 Tax=Loktanella gaetbuli TaxID=2881335 RepID=A0ABS8BX65_9RHOB|nr:MULTISPECIES: H-NS histone family protein [Loktanella]MCB5200313.1 H-NS histone family protein [Loktanella gaetbuli]SEP73324.1 DNA-binding protein H-NS [Loktanella sp. DSM 29012]
MTINLNEMSRKELEKLRKDVDKALKSIEGRELKMAQEAAAKAAAEYGFTLADLSNLPGAKRAAATKSAPKYRNPNDATQTWTGKGRQPDWFKTAIAAGTDPSTLEI